METSPQKRKSLAESKVRNILNNSSAKAQFTFSKSERFPSRASKSATNIRFYDCSVKKFDKNIGFGASKRTEFGKSTGSPAPTQYNISSTFTINNKGMKFKSGRQECKANSVFQSNQNPGPGQYEPNSKLTYKTIHYSLGRRHKESGNNCEETPGPIYQIDSTLLDEKKYLSIYRRRNSTRIFPPRTCFPRRIRTATESSQTKGPNEEENRYVTSKGSRNLGQNNPSVVIPREKRGLQKSYDNNIPGPGQYRSFSEFIDQGFECY